MFYDYKKYPQAPIVNNVKYFYTIIFIQPKILNIKGQAVIFRRKTLQQLFNLLSTYEDTYLHVEVGTSFDQKQMWKKQGIKTNVLVKYGCEYEDILQLIDSEKYDIKKK